MTFDDEEFLRRKAVCEKIDWADTGKFSDEEKDAIVYVTTMYMVRDISAEECAAILKCDAKKLPAPFPAHL